MSCVMCESDAVRLRPAVDVLVVPYSVGVARYTAQGFSSWPSSGNTSVFCVCSLCQLIWQNFNYEGTTSANTLT